MKIYRGRFFSEMDRHSWELELLDTTDGDATGVVEGGSLVLDGDEPLTIEYPLTALHEAIHASAATLRLISTSDRQWVPLYTVNPRGVRLTVRRDGELWWSGCLDPELYEEPFERARDYVVTLTFSDFGVLDRVKFDTDPAAMVSLHQLLVKAVSCFGSVRADGSYYKADMGGARAGGVVLDTRRIFIRAANFYDEDGEAMSLRQVLEGVLVPWGLHIRQRAGRVCLSRPAATDPAGAAAERVEWMGESSTLAVGDVYSEIRDTFSPYGDVELAGVDFSADTINARTLSDKTTARVYLTVEGDDKADSNQMEGFDITTGWADTVPGVRLNDAADFRAHHLAGFFFIKSIYSGSDITGVAELVKTDKADAAAATFGYNRNPLHTTGGVRDAIPRAFALEPIVISPTGTSEARQLRLRVDLLYDTRYNPFETAHDRNEEGDFGRQQKRWNFIYVPMHVWFEGDDGTVKHLSNTRRVYAMNYGDAVRPDDWENGPGEMGDYWLEYYDWKERKNGTAASGWATNRPVVGLYSKGELPAWWEKRGDGAFFPLPVQAGVLHVEFGHGVVALAASGAVWETDMLTNPAGIITPRWALFRDIRLEVVDSHGLTVDASDIVYTTAALAEAQNPLELDTICGTAAGTLPSARGVFFVDTSSGITGPRQALGQITQGGEAASLEAHLLSSLASQYERPLISLSGSVTIPESADAVYTEPTYGTTKHFMLAAERQNLRTNQSEVTLAEIVKPTLKPVENG